MLFSGWTSALVASLALNVAAGVIENRQTASVNQYTQTATSGVAIPSQTLNRLNPSYTTDQLNALKLAYTMTERMTLLQSFGATDDYFKIDLSPYGFKANAANGLGGQGYLAAVQNYPVLLGTGISMAIGYLNPCGFDSMHIHNRATEIVVLVSGTSLNTGFVLEDGFDQPILTTIGLYQATIRPQGAIHYEFNNNCEPAIFVAALSSEDPGVSRTAPNFFVEDPDLVDADLGYPGFLNGVNITAFNNSIPIAFARGSMACLQRCGIVSNSTSNSTSS